MYVCMSINRALLYIYMCVCMYVCICICIYIYIYITYIATQRCVPRRLLTSLYICVLILLNTTIYVSSYLKRIKEVCASTPHNKPLYMCPHTAKYYHTCVLVLAEKKEACASTPPNKSPGQLLERQLGKKSASY